MMGDGFIRAAREHRVKHCHARPYRQYLGCIEIAPEAVKHFDKVALMEGANPPLPGNQPARLAADLKARPKLTHSCHLPADRDHHRFFRRSMP